MLNAGHILGYSTNPYNIGQSWRNIPVILDAGHILGCYTNPSNVGHSLMNILLMLDVGHCWWCPTILFDVGHSWKEIPVMLASSYNSFGSSFEGVFEFKIMLAIAEKNIHSCDVGYL